MKNGFTLVELLVVVAVILLLAVLGIYNMSAAITRTKVSRTQAELSQYLTLRATGKQFPQYDPWGSPYSYSSTTGFYPYSWGPDLIDDGGLIIYDPSNGTVSRGDILAPNSSGLSMPSNH